MMNLDILFENFALLMDSPNSTARMQELILRLAVQGKFVEQDPNDEPASELLKRIKAEKEKLIKEGKIKKEKQLQPINLDEIPWKLPKLWEMARLGNCSFVITKGATPTTYGFQFQNHGIRFVKVENVKKGRIIQSSIKQFISPEAHNAQKRSQLKPGDILFSIAGTIGETCIVNIEDCCGPQVKDNFLLN